MLKIIVSIILLIGIGVVTYLALSSTTPSRIPDVEKLVFQNTMQNIQILELQIAPLERQRQQLLAEANAQVNRWYEERKLDKIKDGLNLQTLEWYKRSEEEQAELKKQEEKSNGK